MTTNSWANLWNEIAIDLEIDPEVFKSAKDVAHLAAKTLFTLGAVTLDPPRQATTMPDKTVVYDNSTSILRTFLNCILTSKKPAIPIMTND